MEPIYHDSVETERLLERARAGQADAAAELWTRYRPALLRLVQMRMDPKLRARVDASDIVQEAQLEANRRLPDYLQRQPLPFYLWLRQITYDRLLMETRKHTAAKRDRNRELPLPDGSSVQLGQQLLANNPTPSAALVKEEFSRRVREAISKLSDNDREIVLLRNYEELSNQEAAQVLSIDPVTASKRYGRALLRLREVLVESGLRETQL